jgi:hypothetical protein
MNLIGQVNFSTAKFLFIILDFDFQDFECVIQISRLSTRNSFPLPIIYCQTIVATNLHFLASLPNFFFWHHS